MVEKKYLDYEKAIKLITDLIPSREDTNKPILFHCIKVGTYLYREQYPRDIVLAGYLHDLLEDTDVSPEKIAGEFGENVLRIIQANSKNPDIKDPVEKKSELIGRCLAAGDEAVIVKAADILDNYEHYELIGYQDGLQYGSKLVTVLMAGIGKLPDERRQRLSNNHIIKELVKFLAKYPLE